MDSMEATRLAREAMAGRTGRAVAESDALAEMLSDLKAGRMDPSDPDQRNAIVDKMTLGLLRDPKVAECILDVVRARERRG